MSVQGTSLDPKKGDFSGSGMGQECCGSDFIATLMLLLASISPVKVPPMGSLDLEPSRGDMGDPEMGVQSRL